MIKSVLPLSFIISLRFFGLFIVLPVISVYAFSLEGANATLVGIVVGGYALTQVIFQTPFGIMSDKLGRKGTIITALLLFAIGSLICPLATDILALLLGRLLQGAGAIGAVVIAMRLYPIISGYSYVPFLFYITMIVSLIAIFRVVKKVPNPPKITHTYND